MANQAKDTSEIPGAPRPDRGQGGFTLLEVIVAVGLLAALTLGVIGTIGAASRLNNLALERSVATGLASERLEAVTSQPFRQRVDVASYALPEETVAGADPEWTFTTDYGGVPGYPDYRRVLTLTYDFPAAPMMRAEARITWRNLHEGQKEHAMIQYLHPELERVQ